MLTGKCALLPMLFILFSSAIVPHSFASVESEALEDIQAGCPDGEILVYRITSKQYVCVEPSTADRWEELGIANIISQYYETSENETSEIVTKGEIEISTSPPLPTKNSRVSINDSECRSGYTLVYRFNHHDTFCTSPSTAHSWERLGLAEIISTDEEPIETSSEEPIETSSEEPIETSSEELRQIDVSLSNSTLNFQFGFPKNIHQLNDRIWVGVGYDVTNTILIEGENGIIMIDPLSSYESVKILLDDFTSISNKPIKTIVFTKLTPELIDVADAFIKHGGGSVEFIIREDLLHFYDKFDDVVFQSSYTYSSKLKVDISSVKMNLSRVVGESSDQTYIVLPDDGGILIGDDVYGISPFLLDLNHIQNNFN